MSTLKADTIVAADGTSPVTLTKQSAAKAWVKFDGTGTIAISESFSTSSLTDVATGQYKTNWTNSFSNSDYACSALSFQNCRFNSQSAGFLEVISAPYYGVPHVDASDVHTIAIGDLA